MPQGLIEQAARRLEELRRGGVEIAGAPRSVPREVAAKVPAIRSPVEDSRLPQLELDLRRLQSLGFVTPDVPRSQISDEFRVIKRPLLLNASATGPTAIRNGNLIMVTSSLPAEGKSFAAVNLAM